MFSHLLGASVWVSFSVKKEHCNPSSNKILISVCESVLITVAITVFNKQVECLIGARVVKASLSVVLADCGGADSVCGVVLSVGEAVLLAGLLGVSLKYLYGLCHHICSRP